MTKNLNALQIFALTHTHTHTHTTITTPRDTVITNEHFAVFTRHNKQEKIKYISMPLRYIQGHVHFTYTYIHIYIADIWIKMHIIYVSK